ncbi:MAG: DUF1998 domain-containing protein [Oscillospiraceae bacterium]|nr:DUF1998 domain-containing protein [Oscillospiraceae bacterium]
MMHPKAREKLNDKLFSVRAPQLVMQYSVGSMVEFSGQTLMVAAPEYWHEDDMYPIHDERLEKQLQVTKFLGFTREEGEKKVIPKVSYVRFPEWYFCPACRRFMSLRDWLEEYRQKAPRDIVETDPHMAKPKNLCCRNGKCRNMHLSPISVVCICEKGHISDFPWVAWTHAQSGKPVCGNPALTLRQDQTANTNIGFRVNCQCGAYASLSGAFGKDQFQLMDERTNGTYALRCSGYHPWKHIHERCSLYPRAIQRGSSAAYFPYVLSSLVIPPFSSQLTSRIQESRAYEKCCDRLRDIVSEAMEDGMTDEQIQNKIRRRLPEFAEKIALEICEDTEKIQEILERRFLEKDDKMDAALSESVQYYWEEYQALSGRVETPHMASGDFVRESMPVSEYHLPHIEGISLISKLHEVKVMIGYTRGTPLEHSFEDAASERLVCIKQKETDWYPAYEARGEGIFIEFDPEWLKAWENQHPAVRERAAIVNRNYRNSFYGKNAHRERSARFILLHTLAHMLIKQLSFACGYPIASLQERIYCSDAAKDGVEMQGLLIYTAGGDSEGTLGGLVRQGMPDTFPSVFREAVQASCLCSNDPVCSLSEGQGRDSLNLSACYSCTLIPETSCSENNCFLDRSMLSGVISDRSIGFYSRELYADNPWESTLPESTPAASAQPKSDHLQILQYGRDCWDIPYAEIWNALSFDAGDTEKQLLQQLRTLNYSGKEKPNEDAEFEVDGKVYSCELLWRESKVMYFSECREEEYCAARQDGEWYCIYSGASGLSVQEILKHIKEV